MGRRPPHGKSKKRKRRPQAPAARETKHRNPSTANQRQQGDTEKPRDRTRRQTRRHRGNQERKSTLSCLVFSLPVLGSAPCFLHLHFGLAQWRLHPIVTGRRFWAVFLSDFETRRGNASSLGARRDKASNSEFMPVRLDRSHELDHAGTSGPLP